MSFNIAVIGLGYVGIPLAVEFGKKYPTVGLDIDKQRVLELRQGIDKTLEVSKSELESAEHLSYTSDIQDAKACNVYIITVPTPINDKNQPDLSPLTKSSATVGEVLKKEI